MLSTAILRSLLVFAALLFLVDIAAACTCFGPRQQEGFHPCMTYGTADAVFTGQVVGVSFARMDANGKPSPFSEKIFHFSVDQTFKGVEGPTVDVLTNPNSPSCGYPFKQGQRYFVYARRDKDGKLKEHLCGPTIPLEEAARDLAYAEEVMRGVNGARIVGAVIRHERSDVKDYGNRSPVPGVEVILERGDQPGERLSKTVTNGEGDYEFLGLSPGTYRVRAALPTGSRELSSDGNPKNNCIWIREAASCESLPFILTTTSSIRGRIVTPEGAPLPQQYLALIPLDENGKEISSSLSPSASSARESGGYFFPIVAAGRYLLAVNPRNKPGKADPVYPLMYYPGVTSREQAMVILVSPSREMNLDDFMLTPPLKERWFSGTVLLADKTPAAGAKVVLIDPNDRMTQTDVTEVIADEQGRFRVKGYESFPYWIDAYVNLKPETEPRWGFIYAPPVKLSTSGSVDGIELVISLNSRAQPYHFP